MPVLDAVCRRYQSLFRADHPEEARLVELHQSGQTEQFLREYFDHEYRKGEAVLAGFAALPHGTPAGRALDFGCGVGGLTYRLAAHCTEAVGLDIKGYKIEFGRQQAGRLGVSNVTLIEYAGGTLPFADDSFDCVLCVDVVEHLPTLDHFVAEFRRVLVPGGRLLLRFGPPWCHPHGKHMWARLPGWWTHLLFPRRVVMRVGGFPPDTTWEQLGIHRLTVGRLHRAMAVGGLTRLYAEERIKTVLRPFKRVPGLRELFIAEVVGVYQKPAVG